MDYERNQDKYDNDVISELLLEKQIKLRLPITM